VMLLLLNSTPIITCVHTLLVSILLYVRLYIKNENIIIVITIISNRNSCIYHITVGHTNYPA